MLSMSPPTSSQRPRQTPPVCTLTLTCSSSGSREHPAAAWGGPAGRKSTFLLPDRPSANNASPLAPWVASSAVCSALYPRDPRRTRLHTPVLQRPPWTSSLGHLPSLPSQFLSHCLPNECLTFTALQGLPLRTPTATWAPHPRLLVTPDAFSETLRVSALFLPRTHLRPRQQEGEAHRQPEPGRPPCCHLTGALAGAVGGSLRRAGHRLPLGVSTKVTLAAVWHGPFSDLTYLLNSPPFI